MATLLEVPLDEGGSFLVEVDDARSAGATTRSGRPESRSVERAQRTFEEALAGLTPAFRVLLEGLRRAAESPEEVEVEFGLKLTTEVGAIIARTGGEANFRVGVRWRRP